MAGLLLAGGHIQSQTVTTLAGSPGNAGFNAGSVSGFSNVRFTNPFGIAVVNSGTYKGDIYVCEEGGHRIRLLQTNGTTTTRAGFGGDPAMGIGYINQNGTNSRFDNPGGIALDFDGNLFVADQMNHAIRKVSKFNGVGNVQVVTTFAGEAPKPGGSTPDYVNGNGTNARFNNPVAIAIDGSNNLYVVDRDNDCIRKITPSGDVSLLAGTPGSPGDVDATGSAAKFNNPTAIAMLDANNVIVADAGNRKVRKVNISTGAVTTFAGRGTSNAGGADGSVATATFRAPSGVAVDKFGDVYVADGWDGQANTIRKISGGQVSTVAGKFQTSGTDNGQGDAARFLQPTHMTFNADGNELYVVDKGNHTIRKIDMKPVADFTANNTNPNINIQVSLSSTSLNNPTSYEWTITPPTGYNWDAGAGPTTANPKVTFTTTGFYTVTLKVTNNFGTSTVSKNNFINVSNTGLTQKPKADFDANTTFGHSNLTVFKFTDKSTNTPNQWNWIVSNAGNVSFQNGTSASSQNPEMMFTANGIYTIRLAATNVIGTDTSAVKFFQLTTVGLKEISLADAISLYPMPARDDVHISIPDGAFSGMVSCEILNMSGAVVSNDKLSSATGRISLNNLQSGIYMIKLSDEIGQMAVKKLIITR